MVCDMEGDYKLAIDRLCIDLGLPRGDQFTQDWAYELPGQFKTLAWHARYVQAYVNASYGDPERRTLVQLTLDVANHLLRKDESAGLDAWQMLIPLFTSSPQLHRDQLEYWALEGVDLEDAFALTPHVRILVEKLYGGATADS
jgi:hypothetical protein